MNHLQLPVFVRLKDSGEVSRYDAVADMQRDLEQIDVENEEYEAWDATAMPLKLSVQRSAEWVRLEPAANPQPGQLAGAIEEFARLQGVPVDTSSLLRGDFSAALEHVTSAVQAKRRARSWWQKFKSRF